VLEKGAYDMTTKAQEKRKHILNSAINFLIENSFDDLTLDAIAKQANVSKGGLLYHFSSKEALCLGIVKQIFQDFINRFNELANKDPIEKGKWTRAYINASLFDINNAGIINIGLMSYSKLSNNSSIDELLQFEYIQSKIAEDGIDPTIAMTIRLAIDGMYYSDMFNIMKLQTEVRNEIIKKLINATYEEERI